jgi:hypothetical protein
VRVMGRSGADQVTHLLRQLVDSYPARASNIRSMLEQSGLKAATIDQLLLLKTGRVTKGVADLATLSPETRSALSPMLAARFAFAGAIHDLSGHMLSTKEIEQTVTKKRFKAIVESHAQHWEGSAPATYPHDRLSLFSIGSLDDANLTYLVWANSRSREPQLWAYSGQHEDRYENLAEYVEFLCT